MSSLPLVQIVVNLADAGGNPLNRGYVSVAPSALLTSVSPNVEVPTAPVGCQLVGTQWPSLSVLPTDTPGVLPSGWNYNVSFITVPGNPAAYSFAAPAGPATFTATLATPSVFTWTPTSALTALPNGTGIQISAPFGGFVAATTYFVVNASGFTFELAATVGGSPLASTAVGSGNLAVTQYYLSALTPTESGTTYQSYLPLPSGTPAAGQVPVATGAGEAIAWQTISGIGTIPSSAEGAADGVATLDGSALVPAAQMRPFNFRGPVAASTAYSPWDVVIYGAKRILIVNSFTTGSGNPPFISFANYVNMGPQDEWHASDYGVLGDSVTDNGATLNNLITEVSANGGGTILLPPGYIMTSQTIVLQTEVHLRGMGWFLSAIKLLPGSNCDVIQFHKSTNGTTDPNAFFCGLWNLEIHGNASAQTPGTYNYGVNCTTNPLSNTGGSDPDHDPTHILFNVLIKLTTGDGYFHNGRSGNRLIGTWVEGAGGNGYVLGPDTEISDCHADNAALGGFYLTHSSDRLTGCKSYNNGLAQPWASGSNYAAGQGVIYSGSLYIAINALTDDTTPPSSDTANWAQITAAGAPAWGCGYYLSGSTATEIALAGCDAQQNAQSGFYLKNCAGNSVTGTVSQINTGNGQGTNQLTNPNDCASLVLDGVTGSVIDLTSLNIGPAGYVMRVVNASAHNDVRMTGDTSAAATLSPDSLTLLGSGNSVSWNGTSLTATLAKLNDVSVPGPTNGQALTWNSATSQWNAVTPPSGNYDGIFGDGSDGSATLDGTAAVSWASKSGSLYTMTRDCWLTGLTVNSGVTLLPNGNRIFCQGTVTNSGSILYNGNPGSGSVAGIAQGTGVLAPGSAGGAGQTGNGTAGATNTSFGVGQSGSGGAGSTGTGGSGASPQSTSAGYLRPPQVFAVGLLSFTNIARSLSGAPGGGGGGGDGANKGGGGGGGAGVIGIAAWAVINTGLISAVGGAGGTPPTGNCGGGGGAAGGLILLYTLTAWANTGTTAVTGGAAGSAVGTGANGTAGNSGNVLNVVIQ